MTGPSPIYRPDPDGNSIGKFQIGGSQVGAIPIFDIWTTILSQYANSDRIIALLQTIFDGVDRTRDLDTLFDKIRNVYTAEGYGLDVWGRIVAIGRVLEVILGPRWFGFEEGLPDYDPFDTSPFWSGQKLTENEILTDDGYRVLILAKAFSNICDGSIPAINRLLVMLFGQSGRCYVADNQNMTITFKFEFPLTPLNNSIIQNSGVIPRPTGVLALVQQVSA